MVKRVTKNRLIYNTKKKFIKEPIFKKKLVVDGKEKSVKNKKSRTIEDLLKKQNGV